MTRARPDFRLVSALLCEDARKDIAGKDILIGVYSGNILVERLPGKMPITAWFNLDVHGPCIFAIEVRVLDPTERETIRGKMKLNVKAEKDSVSTSLPIFLMDIEKEGFIRVQIRRENGKWRNVIKKKITVKVNSE